MSISRHLDTIDEERYSRYHFLRVTWKGISSRVRFRKSLIDVFHQIFNLYDNICTFSFKYSQRTEINRWILSIINSVEDDMIPSQSIRGLCLLSFLECKKIRISFSIDEWLCEFGDVSIIMIFDSFSSYSTLFFSSLLQCIVSNTFRNTQFLSIESKITMNRLLTLVLRIKNMRRRISPIMKVIILSIFQINITTK